MVTGQLETRPLALLLPYFTHVIPTAFHRLAKVNGEGFKFTKRALDGAAAAGQLDMVKWLSAKGVECSTDAMDRAAQEGQLEVVQVRNFDSQSKMFRF